MRIPTFIQNIVAFLVACLLIVGLVLVFVRPGPNPYIAWVQDVPDIGLSALLADDKLVVMGNGCPSDRYKVTLRIFRAADGAGEGSLPNTNVPHPVICGSGFYPQPILAGHMLYTVADTDDLTSDQTIAAYDGTRLQWTLRLPDTFSRVDDLVRGYDHNLYAIIEGDAPRGLHLQLIGIRPETGRIDKEPDITFMMPFAAHPDATSVHFSLAAYKGGLVVAHINGSLLGALQHFSYTGQTAGLQTTAVQDQVVRGNLVTQEGGSVFSGVLDRRISKRCRSAEPFIRAIQAHEPSGARLVWEYPLPDQCNQLVGNIIPLPSGGIIVQIGKVDGGRRLLALNENGRLLWSAGAVDPIVKVDDAGNAIVLDRISSQKAELAVYDGRTGTKKFSFADWPNQLCQRREFGTNQLLAIAPARAYVVIPEAKPKLVALKIPEIRSSYPT